MEELTRIQTAQKDIYKKKEVDDLLNAVKQLMYWFKKIYIIKKDFTYLQMYLFIFLFKENLEQEIKTLKKHNRSPKIHKTQKVLFSFM